MILFLVFFVGRFRACSPLKSPARASASHRLKPSRVAIFARIVADLIRALLAGTRAFFSGAARFYAAIRIVVPLLAPAISAPVLARFSSAVIDVAFRQMRRSKFSF